MMKSLQNAIEFLFDKPFKTLIKEAISILKKQKF